MKTEWSIKENVLDVNNEILLGTTVAKKGYEPVNIRVGVGSASKKCGSQEKRII